MKTSPTQEQLNVLNSESKNLIVSASAGSGKTFVVIEYLTNLIIRKKVPVKRLLVLTFTRAAAGEMRERLNKALIQQRPDKFLLEQIDDLSISDISTIDAFCEKLVRRNIDRLPIDEGFRVMEDPSQIKLSAFENAIVEFEEKATNQLQEIYYSFRKNKNMIFDIMLDLESYFSAIKDSKEKIDYYINNQRELFDKAIILLNKQLALQLSKLQAEIKMTQQIVEDEPKYYEYCKSLENLFAIKETDSFIKNIQNFNMINLPNIPVIRGQNRDEKLADTVKALRIQSKNLLDEYSKYVTDENLIEKQRDGRLAVALLNLYKSYQENYIKIKSKLDVLDFVDIENMALSLINQQDICNDLQEKYDYIFIDEYQDTNRIQEAIVKPIIDNGNFIAVGDPKQGIYGFRNATMEIMQQDIDSFSKQKDGDVAYLCGNFRSDNRLLSFINRIFEKVMTLESVGIDYSQTSVLKGLMPFEKMALPSVRVDIVDVKEEEKEAATKDIYSVKEDDLFIEDKNKNEIQTIVARIDNLLVQKIYDEKDKQFRQINFDDIVILFRNRGTLMSDLARELSNRGYPVLSDEKHLETDEPEVQMLINLCRLLINKEDDIALVSVMSSFLGGFTLDDIAGLRLKNPNEKFFYNILKLEEENIKIQSFINMLDSLYLQAEVNGLYFALNQLFTDKEYFAYLKYNNISSYLQVNNFLQDILSNDLDFNIPEVISYFTDIGGKKRNTIVSGSGAIKLMTIHASKGLEFPIVVLAGAGRTIEKINTKNYAINGEFGLGTYLFDENTNTKSTTPVMEIIKQQNHRKDMIDEIMIFYVALTRAKNHLYIVGQENIMSMLLSKDFNVLDAKNYLSWIAFAFGEEFINCLIEKESLTIGDWEFNLVTKIKEAKSPMETSKVVEEVDDKVVNSLTRYFDFGYDGKDYCKLNLKNTVTALNSKNNPQLNHKIILEEVENSNFIEQGNAYHEAMKLIDFKLVEDMQSLEKQICLHNKDFTEGYLALIDKTILLKNILLIKNLTVNKNIYKEKQFVMMASLEEIFGLNNKQKILVQGIVDFFGLGEENVLIDYKFTQEKNNKKILEKYSKQLDLYSLAIEKGFNIKINKKYILSLKNAELIEYIK